jgi:hypothetical protein
VQHDTSCARCGLIFRPKRSEQRFCSRQCAGLASGYRAVLAERACETCGQYFAPRFSRQANCSRQCGFAWQKARCTRKPKATRARSLLCQRCGSPFVSTQAALWCSESCRRDVSRSRRRAAGLRRNARVSGARIEAFSHVGIFERDGWRCGICGDLVDRRLQYPDPLSASLDHIITLARGGAHSPENTRLAHLGCNWRRGNARDLAS